MWSTVGGILTVVGALLCSHGMWMLWRCSRAERAKQRSRQVSASTSSDPVPPKWESRLLELAAEVSSLSSTLEKVLREQRKREQRDAMRVLRSSESAEPAPLPYGTSKSELRRRYGLTGKSHMEIARMAATGGINNGNGESA